MKSHGQSGTPLYMAWKAMRWRVRNRPTYRDVTIDERWATIEGFMANPPGGTYEPGMVLSRIGDLGPYSPENARWQTKQQNGREAMERSMVRLTDGRFLADVAKEHNMRTTAYLAWLVNNRRPGDTTPIII